VLADAGQPALWVDRQAPQAGAALGIAERVHVVDAGDGAHHLAGDRVLGDQIGEGVVVRDVHEQ